MVKSGGLIVEEMYELQEGSWSFGYEQFLSGGSGFTDLKFEVYSNKAGFPDSDPLWDLGHPVMEPSQHAAPSLLAAGGRGGCVFGALPLP